MLLHLHICVLIFQAAAAETGNSALLSCVGPPFPPPQQHSRHPSFKTMPKQQSEFVICHSQSLPYLNNSDKTKKSHSTAENYHLRDLSLPMNCVPEKLSIELLKTAVPLHSFSQSTPTSSLSSPCSHILSADSSYHSLLAGHEQPIQSFNISVSQPPISFETLTHKKHINFQNLEGPSELNLHNLRHKKYSEQNPKTCVLENCSKILPSTSTFKSKLHAYSFYDCKVSVSLTSLEHKNCRLHQYHQWRTNRSVSEGNIFPFKHTNKNVKRSQSNLQCIEMKNYLNLSGELTQSLVDVSNNSHHVTISVRSTPSNVSLFSFTNEILPYTYLNSLMEDVTSECSSSHSHSSWNASLQREPPNAEMYSYASNKFDDDAMENKKFFKSSQETSLLSTKIQPRKIITCPSYEENIFCSKLFSENHLSKQYERIDEVFQGIGLQHIIYLGNNSCEEIYLHKSDPVLTMTSEMTDKYSSSTHVKLRRNNSTNNVISTDNFQCFQEMKNLTNKSTEKQLYVNEPITDSIIDVYKYVDR